MSSDQIIDPESTKLLTIFPQEIWTLILENVDNSTDYHRLCRASPFFFRLLYPHRPRILFPEVCKVLHQQLENRSYSAPARYTEECQKLLVCRRVCHAWRQGVDRVLQNLPHFYNFTYDYDLHESWYYGLAKFPREMVCKPEYVQDLYQHFGDTPGVNPFLRRCVIISLEADHDSHSDFHQALSKLLARYGHQIWYCSIRVKAVEWKGQVITYTRLASVLTLLPNLKVICISPWNPRQMPEQARQELDAHFETHSMPNLPKLEFISGGNSLATTKALMVSNPHVKVLEVGKWQCESYRTIYNQEENAANPRLVPQLEQLSIYLEKTEEFREFEEGVPRWRLRKMDVNVEHTEVQWRDLARVLDERFGPTLNELEAWLPLLKHVEMPEEDCRLLPHLQVLHLRLKDFDPLDMLLPIRDSLKELTILMDGMTQFRIMKIRDGRIKFYEYRHEIWKSNIWGEFKKLKIVKYAVGYHLLFSDFYTCTREQWGSYWESKGLM